MNNCFCYIKKVGCKIIKQIFCFIKVNGELGSENTFADLACKRDEIHKRLAKENEKLHEIKTDLLQELMVRTFLHVSDMK